MKTSLNEIYPYIGDMNQLISIRESRLTNGKQDGVKMIEVENGGNLSAAILPGRGMDIYQVRYKGQNINYIAPCGIVGPQYYESKGTNWLLSFFVGFLTTCGMQHIGAPIEIDGEERGLHGRVSNTPAENVHITRGDKNGVPSALIEGDIKEARIFGPNLLLKRKYEFVYGEDCIILHDEIINHGYADTPVLLSYHLNYGYPLLEEGTKLIIDSEKVMSRSDDAKKHEDTWQQVEAPEYPYPERCYFHTLKKDSNGMTGYTIFNEKRKIGVNVNYSGDDLPYFCQWKMLSKGEYVMGLEPLNSELDGPKIGQPGCKAPVVKAGDKICYTIKICFIDKCS